MYRKKLLVLSRTAVAVCRSGVSDDDNSRRWKAGGVSEPLEKLEIKAKERMMFIYIYQSSLCSKILVTNNKKYKLTNVYYY